MNINYSLTVNPVKVTDYLTTKTIKKRRFNPLDIYTTAQTCGKVTDDDVLNLAIFLARALLKKLYIHSANKEIFNRRIELEKAISMLSRHDDDDEKPDIIPYAYDYVNQFVAEILANQTTAATLLTEFTDYKPNKHVIAQGKKTAALVETTETPLQVIWHNVRKYIDAQNLRADRSVYSYVSLNDYSDDDDGGVTYAADKVYYRFYKYSDVCDVIHSHIPRKKAKDNVPKTTAAANIDDWIYVDNIIDALKLTKRELTILKYRIQGLTENDIVTTMNKPKKRKDKKTGEYITDKDGKIILFPPKTPITRNSVHGALMRIRKKALAIGLNEKTISKYIDGITPTKYIITNTATTATTETTDFDKIDYIIANMSSKRFIELRRAKRDGKFSEKIEIIGYTDDGKKTSEHFQTIEFNFNSTIPDYRIIPE